MYNTDLDEIQALYDQHLYVDAFQQTRDLWQPENVDSLKLEELILAGRLSWRLGGFKVSRWLFREALKRDPNSPLVIYFARNARRINESIIDLIRYYQEQPNLKTDDRDLASSWYASQACTWAHVRDFDKAFDLINKARELDGNSHWVELCYAWILFHSDEWHEAHNTALSLWEQRPGMPFCAQLMGSTSCRMGQLDLAVERLLPEAEKKQSWEVVSIAIYHLCTFAEQKHVSQRSELVESGHRLVPLLETTMPLQDRFGKRLAASHTLDLAALTNDRELLQKTAKGENNKFYQTLAKNLSSNEPVPRKMTKCRRIPQKHNTCLPASTATVLSHFGIEVDHDALVNEVTSAGTPTWRITKWAEAKGFSTKSFRVSNDNASDLIKHDIPFIIMYEGLTMGHAMAVIGIDETAGLTIIHDPSSERLHEVLSEHLADQAAPFGPEGLLIVPPEQQRALQLISDDDSIPMTAWVQQLQEFSTTSPTAANRKSLPAAQQFADDPISRRARVQQLLFTGAVQQAYNLQEKLLQDFPQSLTAANDLLNIVHRLRNHALTVKVLRELVERKRLPGISSEQPWQYAPAEYTVRLADFIKHSQATNPEARQLLDDLARRGVLSGELFHVLGDTLHFSGAFKESLLPYRLAMTLEEHDNHYARAFADACRRCAREEEGLTVLQRRIEKYGNGPESASIWTTAIEAYEDYGHPEQAIELMKQAMEECPDQDCLCAFASMFWLRYESPDLAEKAMKTVQQADNLILRYATTSQYYAWIGDWQQALNAARKWQDEDKLSMAARERILYLLPHETNLTDSVNLAEQWVHENPDNEDYEQLFLQQLNDVFDSDRRISYLEKMVARNPMDGWAWRELGHEIESKLSTAHETERSELLQQSRKIVEECRKTDPDEFGTLNLLARVAERERDEVRAISLYLQALDHAPESTYCYNALWDLARLHPKPFKESILTQCEERLNKCTGHLFAAATVAGHTAAQLGVYVALAALQRWGTDRQDDPEIAATTANILYDYGKGVTDAKKAVQILEDAVLRFPHNVTLRMELARGYRICDQTDDAIAILEGLLRRCPTHSAARISLARDLLVSNQTEAAIELIRAGVSMTPANSSLWDALGEIQWTTGDYHGTLETLRQGIQKNPENIMLHEHHIDCLVDMNRHEEAVEIAKHLTEVFPDGAYCWHIYGKTMLRGAEHANYSDAIDAFRKALEFNSNLIDPLQELALLHVNRKEFSKARELLEEHLPDFADPFPINYMIARVYRSEGKARKATTKLAKLLKEHPLNEEGWHTLLYWIEEDQSWEMVNKVVSALPPALLQDPDIFAQKLAIQRLAGTPPAELDPEWERLLADFPENAVVYQRRFDDLWEDRRYDMAHEVILKIYERQPQSAYVLARLVRSHGKKGNRQDAIDATLAIWKSPGEEEWWPVVVSWEIISERKWTKETVERGVQLLKEGECLRGDAFTYISQQRVSTSAKKTHELLDILDEAGWDTDEMTATLLMEMSDKNMRHGVLEYWKKIKNSPEQVGTLVWQAIGRALYILNKNHDCLDWMSNWRSRNGAQMWAMSFYLLAIKQVDGDPELLYKDSRSVWTEMKHDNAALLTAYLVGEGALRTERFEEFVMLVKEAKPYLTKKDKEQWVPDIGFLPRYSRYFKYLQEFFTASDSSPKNLKMLTKRIRGMEGAMPKWLKHMWFSMIREHLSWFSALWLEWTTKTGN